MGPRQQRPSQLKDSFGTSGRAITEPLHKNIYTAKRDGRPLRSVRGGGGVPALSQATDKIPTYVVGLDARLSGGIPRGQIVLVAGPPGSLKSSFVYLFQFYEELRDLNATTFLVSEMPRDATAFAHFGVEEFLADTIIHLRLREVDVGMSTSVRRYIGVVKMRGAEHDLDYFPLLVEHGT